MKEQNLDTRATLLNSIKNSVSLSYDVKKNQFLKLLEDFSKRYLRLKIVQHNKRTMSAHMPSMNQGGLGFDADQMSMSGASSFSESQQSSTSGRSSASSFSQTSKKSKRVTEKRKKKKMRKSRVVKEGSPFEEDNLIELLKEEIKMQIEEKEEVKNVMNALVYFGQIELSTSLHGLVERLIRAEQVCVKLFSVEQENTLSQQPDLQEYYFADILGTAKTDESYNAAKKEWETFKFIKH